MELLSYFIVFGMVCCICAAATLLASYFLKGSK